MFQTFLVKKEAGDFGCVCKVVDAPNSTGLNQLTCIHVLGMHTLFHRRKGRLQEGQP